jgi:1-acyl-sn-glycerol-3-phosphate acyltransferase
MMMWIRSAFFYVGYATATIVWGALGTVFGWLLPYRLRFSLIIGVWTWFCLTWLRITCGIRHRIVGLDRIPKQPCIVLCRHESTWETMFLQRLFAPQATLIKRELLWIPFFGWAFSTLKPIAIDRHQQRKALRTLIQEGTSRLAGGTWVVLFPEGTRMAPGQLGPLHPGGAALGSASGVPILVVVHDAGSYWPAHRFLKRPGTVRVLISEPVSTDGLTSKEVQAQVSKLFVKQMAELNQPAEAPGASAPGSATPTPGVHTPSR